MLYTTDVAVWLAAQPPLAQYFPATPELSPDGRWVTCVGATMLVTFDAYPTPGDSGPRLVVDVSGGAATQNERTVDVHFLDLLVFGPSDDHRGAEHITSDVDDTLMGLDPPLDIPSSDTDGMSTRLISLDYTGGPPHFLRRDQPGLGARSIFTAGYVLRTARSVF